jgi:hypothetical protein
MKRVVVGCALFAGLACSASAETVYRCGPGGNSYSQLPCHDGRVLDAADRRSAEDVEAARRVARTEQITGDSLERERLQRETAPPRMGSLSPMPSRADGASETSTSKKKKDRPKDFTIKLPKPKKSRSS